MLTPKDRVLAGVSGGADSTALLLVLGELGYDVAVAHLNHGLRGEQSDEDESFVKALAGKLGVPCFTRSVKIDPAGGNIEASGRDARRAFFQALLQEHGFTKIALAHNREDRVETFLLHLMRGAGSEGLVSMAPVAGEIIRPLIETPRQAVEAYLEKRAQPWRTDATNFDISFGRNRIRHEILPRLASLFNTRLIESLTRTITILQDEDQWMRELTQSWLDEFGGAGFDVEAMKRLPTAMVKRLIREGLRRGGWNLTDITFDHVEAVRSLLEEGKSGKVIQLPGSVVAVREFNRIVFRGETAAVTDFAYDLPIPGSVRVPEVGRVFRATCLEDSTTVEEGAARVLVDGGLLGGYVKIRNWKPGDYYKPAGWPAGKVKKLFQRARVPRSQRHRWPIFVTESTIIWVTSFPVSREFTPGACSKKIVAFEALEG
jgi:tRNA(Ile)-lysidine synthase